MRARNCCAPSPKTQQLQLWRLVQQARLHLPIQQLGRRSAARANNGANWPVIGPLLANPALKPAPADIQCAFDHVEVLLAMRKVPPSSAWRPNQMSRRDPLLQYRPRPTAGLDRHGLSDKVAGLPDLDPNHELIVVFQCQRRGADLYGTDLCRSRPTPTPSACRCGRPGCQTGQLCQ